MDDTLLIIFFICQITSVSIAMFMPIKYKQIRRLAAIILGIAIGIFISIIIIENNYILIKF